MEQPDCQIAFEGEVKARFGILPNFFRSARAAPELIQQLWSFANRADNLKLYQDVEDASLYLYAAVRNGYLQRRQKSIEDAIRQRDKELESESFFAQDGDFGQRAMVFH